MMRNTQYSLFEQRPKRGRKPQKPNGHFGGVYLKNYNPKSKRPMDSKKALHLVLKSSYAVGVKTFKGAAYEAKIWDIVYNHAEKCGVKIYEYANGGDHLHLLIRAKYREDFNRFIRTISGLIARLVGGSEKGKPLKRKFWDARPFTRIVAFTKKVFQAAKAYLLRNNLEAIGWMSYVPRPKRLSPEARNWLKGTLYNSA
jgi:REP element-mobilizing transposase RayT